MVPQRSYLICCTPRSGSYLLCDALGQTCVAGHPAEHFPPPSQAADGEGLSYDWAFSERPPASLRYDPAEDAAYVSRIVEVATTPNRVLGLKIHWFQLPDALRRLEAYVGKSASTPAALLGAALPRLSYVWLTRRDKVSQAVSWARAVATNRFTVRRDDRSAADGMPPSFDFATVRTYFSALTSADRGWQHFFFQHDIRPITIVYEDFVASYADTILRLLRSLEIDTEGLAIPEPRLRRMADATSDEWVRRYLEMRDSRASGRALMNAERM